MKILITAGATIEFIDKVRFITNLSTGKTGTDIADILSKNHIVYYMHGIYSKKPKKAKKYIPFINFKDLNQKLKYLLHKENFDIIIHLAAVSDYSVKIIKLGNKRINNPVKIDSSKNLTIYFKRNFKIINKLGTYAKNNPLIVGFKLTSNENTEKIETTVSKLKCDIVVHNDTDDIGNLKRKFTIFRKNNQTTVYGIKKLTNILLYLKTKFSILERTEAETSRRIPRGKNMH